MGTFLSMAFFSFECNNPIEAPMVDMTEGRIMPHLFKYAVPILLGNWLQLLYNAVDSMIAGRFIGRDALAAEGIASPVMNLIILFISGLCIGSGVLMSQAYGRKDYKKLKESQSTLLLFGLISSTVVSFIAYLLSPFILEALKCPDEIYEMTNIYLRIIFLGTPFTFLYNALAAGLKSVGDSSTPLKFLAFSSVLNAVLDIIFLGLFHFGIICSAMTTVIAEFLSALLALWHMIKHEPQLWPGREYLVIKIPLLREILVYGGPTALQQAIQPIGKVLIQSRVNALGVDTIAAYNAATRMDDAACIPEQGIATAIATFTAQNWGAGKKERIREGFRNGLLLEFSYWILIALFTSILHSRILSLFVAGNNASSVIDIGSGYLSIMAVFYIFPAFTNGFQGFYRGMGKMYTTLLGTLIQTTLRTLFTFILAPLFGIEGIAYSCALGWSCMLLFEIPLYFVVRKKLLKTS